MSSSPWTVRLASAGVVLLLIAGCGTADDDGSEPSATATGADEFAPFEDDIPTDFAPPPVLCDPGQPELRKLEDPQPVDRPVGVALGVTVENSDGQAFRLVFWGQDGDVVLEDIATTQVCLEAQPAPDVTERAPAASLDDIVVDALVVVSGRTQEELAVLRDASLSSGSPTLAGIAAMVGAEPRLVSARARDVALAEFGGVDAGTVQRAVESILVEPGAPALVRPSELPGDERGYEALVRESADVVVVEVALLDPTSDKYPEESWPADTPAAVSYYFDPVVHLNRKPKKRHYVAKCQSSVSVTLKANQGRMNVRLTRDGVAVGTRTADRDGRPEPPGLYDDSTSNRTYDIRVRGFEDNSHYNVYGGWTLGSGGGCA